MGVLDRGDYTCSKDQYERDNTEQSEDVETDEDGTGRPRGKEWLDRVRVHLVLYFEIGCRISI